VCKWFHALCHKWRLKPRVDDVAGNICQALLQGKSAEVMQSGASAESGTVANLFKFFRGQTAASAAAAVPSGKGGKFAEDKR